VRVNDPQQADPIAARMRVRPVFAAVVFGGLVVLLLLLALLAGVSFLRQPSLDRAQMWFSILCPRVPLAWFAVRGFLAGRGDAFAGMPEGMCAAGAALFAALALLVGAASGVWVFAFGPAFAALFFALCLRSVREALLLLP